MCSKVIHIFQTIRSQFPKIMLSIKLMILFLFPLFVFILFLKHVNDPIPSTYKDWI